MIELAPHHKIGLPLANPVMIASGCGGYGTAYHHLIDLTAFGAMVTNPITLRPWSGSAQPRLAETRAGFVLNTGFENAGVRKVIRQNHKEWSRLGLPVIAHLPADDPDDLRRTARALAGSEAIAAIELGLPEGIIWPDIQPWARAVREGCLLPLLLKLPYEGALDLAEGAAGLADALVVSAPPLGAALPPGSEEPVRGYLYGPLLHGLVLELLLVLNSMVDLPVVAVGGIHTLADAQAFLQAGASAVQIDSLLFIDPVEAETIARGIGEESQ